MAAFDYVAVDEGGRTIRLRSAGFSSSVIAST